MGGGGGLGFFAGTIGSQKTDAFARGTLVAAAAQLGTVSDAGGGMGDGGNKQITLPQALTSALVNLGPSAMNFGRDLLDAASNPLQTGAGLAKVVAGYVCQATGMQNESRVYSDAVTLYFKNRYGSMANIKQTLATDPVGFAADMSLFLTGGSGAFRSAASAASAAAKVAPVGKVAQGASKVAGGVGKAGETLGKVGNVLDPLSWGGAGIKAGNPSVLYSIPPFLQELSKKSGTAITRGKTALGIGGTGRAVERERKR